MAFIIQAKPAWLQKVYKCITALLAKHDTALEELFEYERSLFVFEQLSERENALLMTLMYFNAVGSIFGKLKTCLETISKSLGAI